MDCHSTATITTHFGIAEPVPFVDVNAYTDTRLFVDPRAVRLQGAPSPFVDEANWCTKTFFDEIRRCITSSSSSENQRALSLLQQFKEPKQTRLGLAKNGIEGHGGSAVVGRWIWETLSNDANALLHVAVLKWVEDLPLFVEGVGNDITSDLTTRIIYGPLADFTGKMVASYPQLRAGNHKIVSSTHQVWNPVELEWETRSIELPSVDGVPLLLVPKNWVRGTLLMSATRYYETEMLSYVQRSGAPRDARGKLILTPKYKLKESGQYPRGRDTIIRVTTEAARNGDDPLANFRTFVDDRFSPLELFPAD